MEIESLFALLRLVVSRLSGVGVSTFRVGRRPRRPGVVTAGPVLVALTGFRRGAIDLKHNTRFISLR
jgi:hypothetical protein